MPDAPNRIREARKARGMTLEELAPRMQMSWSELAKIERDERPLTTEHLRRAA
ncbi:MAG: helix-turn-helix transcriptional regulator, partial [Alphaproteobacteria bacterium]|nr:helix-turn-helix transcriptional regulator [Alphaproteobacteria bacterium]